MDEAQLASHEKPAKPKAKRDITGEEILAIATKAAVVIEQGLDALQKEGVGIDYLTNDRILAALVNAKANKATLSVNR